MVMIDRLRRRLRALFSRGEVEREMTEEFRAHIEMETDWLARTEGLSMPEARRRAHVSFGGITRFEERTRDARGVRPLEEFVRDIRLVLRTLRRNPAFASVVILTLGLGIGSITGIFSIVNSVVLKPLPYQDADELVAIRHAAPGLGLDATGLSTGTYFHYRAHAAAIADLAIYTETVLNLATDEGTERIRIARAGPDLFRVLRVQPALGRLYTESDWTGTSMDLNWTIPILLSHEFWQDRFGGDPSIIGRILTINDSPREVFGVLPEGFEFPSSETQVWHMDLPHEPSALFAASFDYGSVGRLRDGATVADATLDMQRALASIEGAYEDATPSRVADLQLQPLVVPLKTDVVGRTAGALWILFGGMAFLLVVACANVANLFLVRGESRSREIAVRTALGASRSALGRLFFAESFVLTALGALLGLGITAIGVRLLVIFTPVELPRLDEVRLDGRVLAFAMVVTLLAAAGFGLLSLLRHSRARTMALALKSGGTTGEGRERRRVMDTLVAAQVALTLALLAGSVLMVQSYVKLSSVDAGYNAEGVLTIEVGVPFRKAAQHQELYDAIAERMRGIPGGSAVGGVSVLPLDGGGEEHPLRLAEPGSLNTESAALANGSEPVVAFRFFVPGYFQTMGAETVEGSAFASGERTELSYPVVISERLAQRMFQGQRAVGKRIERLDSDGEPVVMLRRVDGIRRAVALPPYTVAGVVGDMRDESLHARGGEAIYIPVIDPPVEQSIMSTQMSFVLRTELPPLALAAAARRAVHEVDGSLSVARTRTMNEIVADSTAMERFMTVLLLIAGAASLMLGTVGIYGIGAYTVRRRTPEIGLRVALGAAPRSVLVMVLRDSLAVVAVGAIAGIAAAVVGTRALRGLLFEVAPAEPMVLVSVTVLLIIVATAATLVPARRAARTDATLALRADSN